MTSCIRLALLLLVLLVSATMCANGQSAHSRWHRCASDSTIPYSGYTIVYSPARKVPAYTVHRLTPQQIRDSSEAGIPRSDRFYADNERAGTPTANQVDYKGSGYDRGHHAPAGDFRWHAAQKQETFSYANMSPQTPGLNRYALAGIERQIRNRTRQWNDTAWIITGTHFALGSDSTIGPQQVGVPTHIYKVVYWPNKQRMAAFLLDNRVGWVDSNFKLHQVTVDELEQIIGLDFFNRVTQDDAAKLESRLRLL